MYGDLTRALSRRERERLMRRRAMLEAAQAVFAEKGYAHATVDEIAQRAEFGKGTLYNYFAGGKEDILFAIFDELYDDLCTLITQTFTPEAVAQHPIRTLFHHLFEASLSFFVERQDLFMILIKEAHRMMFSEEAEKAGYFIRQRARAVAALRRPIEDAISRGELKPLPAEPLAHMILNHINGLQMHLCLCNTEATPEVTSREAADFLTVILFEGILTSSPSQPASTVSETVPPCS